MQKAAPLFLLFLFLLPGEVTAPFHARRQLSFFPSHSFFPFVTRCLAGRIGLVKISFSLGTALPRFFSITAEQVAPPILPSAKPPPPLFGKKIG